MTEVEFGERLAGETDEDVLRRYRRQKVAEHAAQRDANRETIVGEATVIGTWFYEGQSADEVLQTKQFLVDMGLAEWLIKR